MADITMHPEHHHDHHHNHGHHHHTTATASNRHMLPYVAITGAVLGLLTLLLSGYPGEDRAGVSAKHAVQTQSHQAAGAHQDGGNAGQVGGAVPGTAPGEGPEPRAVGGSNDAGTHGSKNANAPANNNSGAPRSAEGPY